MQHTVCEWMLAHDIVVAYVQIYSDHLDLCGWVYCSADLLSISKLGGSPGKQRCKIHKPVRKFGVFCLNADYGTRSILIYHIACWSSQNISTIHIIATLFLWWLSTTLSTLKENTTDLFVFGALFRRSSEWNIIESCIGKCIHRIRFASTLSRSFDCRVHIAGDRPQGSWLRWHPGWSVIGGFLIGCWIAVSINLLKWLAVRLRFLLSLSVEF